MSETAQTIEEKRDLVKKMYESPNDAEIIDLSKPLEIAEEELPITEDIIEVAAEDKAESEKKGNATEKKHWRERLEENKEKQEEPNQLSDEIRNLKEKYSHPSYKVLEEALEKGEDPYSAFGKISIPDPSSLTPIQLFAADLEQYKSSMTSEQIEEAIEDFKSLKPYQQIKETEKIKNELEKQRNEQIEAYKPKPKVYSPELIAKVEKFEADLAKKIDALDGAVYNGTSYTPKEIDAVDKLLKQGLINPKLFKDDTGEWNPDIAIELANFVVNRKSYIEGLKRVADSEGQIKALELKHNVGSGKAKTTGLPDTSINSRASKLAAINQMYPSRVAV